ncbi:MAG: glycoside hydrolase family 13 protein [Anaerolineaceae bacterium]|jgi:glycosidase
MTNMPFASGWIQDAIFYQIFPDRFANGDPTNDPAGTKPWGSPPTRNNFCGGDLQGILDHLDHLENLGITALYLTPIFKARSNHKYDTCDYLSVDPAFGSNELLRQLVDACHTRGMRVILDAVFNHSGDGFWAFEDLCQHGSASAYADWFFPGGFPIQQDPPNYQTCGGVGFLPKLNTANPALRNYLLHVSRYWLEEAHTDGWRLDVPWKVPLEFWREFRQIVKTTKPEAYIVGEIWRDPAPWLAGDTCDGIMNYPLRDAILDYCVRDTMDAEDFDYVTGCLRQVYGSASPFQMNLLGSHDTPRLLTICGGNIQRAVLAITAQFTEVGVPMVYYGDEVGLEGENDPGCRGCMLWEPQTWNQTLLDVYHTLIRARRDHPALRSDSFESLKVFNGIYAYRRAFGEDQVVVVLNPRQVYPNFNLSLAGPQTWLDILSGQVFYASEGMLRFDRISAQTALVLIPQS